MNFEKTGIDFAKYRTTQVSEAISKALNFPSAATNNLVLLPLFLTLIFVAVGVAIGVAGHWIVGILFALLGLISMPFSGFIIGLARFANSVTHDSETIFATTLDLVKNVAQDILILKSTQPDTMSSFSDITKGLNQQVVIPIATDIIRKKLPFAGARAARMVENMLNKASQTVSESANTMGDGAFNNTANPNLSKLEIYCHRLIATATNAQKNIGKLTFVAKNFVVRPLRWTANIVLILNIIVFGTLLLILGFGG